MDENRILDTIGAVVTKTAEQVHAIDFNKFKLNLHVLFNELAKKGNLSSDTRIIKEVLEQGLESLEKEQKLFQQKYQDSLAELDNISKQNPGTEPMVQLAKKNMEELYKYQQNKPTTISELNKKIKAIKTTSKLEISKKESSQKSI